MKVLFSRHREDTKKIGIQDQDIETLTLKNLDLQVPEVKLTSWKMS